MNLKKHATKLAKGVALAVALACAPLAAHAAFKPDAPTVLVTGANRGIGLELARQYAAKGWNVIATSRRPIDDKGTDLSARVTDRTVVLVHDGSGWVTGSLNDVQPDAQVRVWVDGGTLTKSLPPQGDVATIAVGEGEG